MNVKELKEFLKNFSDDAIVVSGEKDGAWTVLSKPIHTKYENLNICLLKEGY